MHGSERGRWKHDLPNPWPVGVPVRQRSTLRVNGLEGAAPSAPGIPRRPLGLLVQTTPRRRSAIGDR